MRSLLGLAAALGLAWAPALAEPVKMGFVYPSPVGDVGWAKELDRGRASIEAAFPGKVTSVIAENIPEGPDAARTMTQMIADGAKIMMIGSFGYMNDGLRLARQNPGVAFLHASGYKTADNFSVFQSRNYESAYIGGMAGGAMTKSKVFGIVAAYPIPEVIGIINAFALGAQKHAPDATFKVVWLNSWFDPSKSQEAARSLAAQGADVIFSLYQDTPEVVSLAPELGVLVLNTSSDMSSFAPGHYLMGMGVDWGPFFTSEVGKALAGEHKGQSYWGGMKDGAVLVHALHPDIPAPVRAEIDATMAAIKAGAFHPMTGPIVDQDGKERLAAGVTITDEAMFGIDWLVKGVETRIPK